MAKGSQHFKRVSITLTDEYLTLLKTLTDSVNFMTRRKTSKSELIRLCIHNLSKMDTAEILRNLNEM